MKRPVLPILCVMAMAPRLSTAGNVARQSLDFTIDTCLMFSLQDHVVPFTVRSLPNNGTATDIHTTKYDFLSNIHAPDAAKIVVSISQDMPAGTSLSITGGSIPAPHQSEGILGDVTSVPRDVVVNIPPSEGIGLMIEYTFSVTAAAKPGIHVRDIQYTVMAQ